MVSGNGPVSTAVDYDPFAEAPLAKAVASTEPQREIWLAAKLEPEASLAYNEAVAISLQGTLELAALRAALQGLAARHEALRGTLGANGEDFFIAEQIDLPCPLQDLRALDGAARDAALEAAKHRVVTTPFDLEKGPLVRAEILQLGDEDHLLLFSAHHIVCDGWSFGVIAGDLAALYAQASGGDAALAPADSFADFALALAAGANGDTHRADEAYWVARFAGSVPVLDLPTDRPRPPRRGFASARTDVLIDAALVAAAKQVGAKRRASLYATLLATFGVLLQRLSGQDDVVIGIPAAGQAGGGHQNLVGHCVNVLPLRASVDASAPFADLLDRVRVDLLDAFEHQQYTVGSLLKRLAIARDPSRLPLVSVLFNLDQVLDESTVTFPGLRFRLDGVPRAYENFELFVNAVQVDGALRLECQYNSALFDAATVRYWLDAYATLLASVVEDATQPVMKLCAVSPDMRAALDRLQPSPIAFDSSANVAGLLFAQAERTPARAALRCGDLRWTYAELAARSRAVARALRRRGVGRGALVGVCLERGADMVASVLGVLATGAGYVPLDPSFPRDRLDFMSRDAGLAVLLTQQSLLGTLDWPVENSLRIEDIDDAPAAFAVDGGGEDVAYVIYTSGSTGKPKGVRVPHRAVANFLASMAREPGLVANDRLLAVTTLSFDIAVLELYLPLFVGAEVVVATREQSMDGHALAELLRASAATVMQATPSTWRLLLEVGWNGAPGFKALCGGESLPADVASRLLERCASLWNMYGPTETTVWSTCARVGDASRLSIGQPIDNTQVWILDADRQPCPIGVPGEIGIGGAGVTLGYLDRPELTADRFIADTFGGDADARLYRTGDRGRWRSDGSLEHLGRLDFQVKLRGFRIELGEIEATLAAHPAVAEAIALVREDRPGDQRLVAYLRLKPAMSVDDAALRKHLRASLPDYMVPQHFVTLAAIPLLPNGKIDRKALPAPHAPAPAAGPVAPRNELEQRIATAMEEALALPGIGVHDDFFALGGHSLLAAQLTARLNRDFGANLSLRALFDAPTVAALAETIAAADGSAAAAAPSIDARSEQALAPLSLLQKRLWLFEQLNPDTVVYNTPSAHRLRGPFDEQAFQKAFDALVQRQAVLRTSIDYVGEEPVQRVHESVDTTLLPAEDLSATPAGEREAELMRRLEDLSDRPFDLAQAPLFRARLFRLAPDEHVLFFTPHHIVWDGWSFDLFYEEFSALYTAFRRGEPSPLKPLPVSYGDFAAWHESWLQGPEYAAQFQRRKEIWRERLAQWGAPRPLPTDKPRGDAQSGPGDTEWIRLPKALTDRLREAGRQADATVFVVLLAAYSVLLSRIAGDRHLVIGTPVRVRGAVELENIMGLFTNLLPLPIEVDPDAGFAALVTRVKAVVLDSLADPDVQLEDLLRDPDLREVAGGSAFYQAQFSYQDARHRVRDWGGLQQEQVLLFQRGASEDIALWFLEHDQGMTGGLLYNTDLLRPETARLLKRQYLALLERIADDIAQPVLALEGADAADAEQIGQWNEADDDGLAPVQQVHALFEAAADRYPQQTAVTSGSWGTDYAELERRANRIAACLRTRGAGAGSLVGLACAAGANRVAALLGILKAGGACVALDAAADAESLKQAIDAAGVAIIVGESAFGQRIGWPAERGLWLDTAGTELAAASAERNDTAVGSDVPAYATGAVRLSHRSLASRVADACGRLGIEAGATVVAISGATSDTFETLVALAAGAEFMRAQAGASAMDIAGLLERLADRAAVFVFAPAATWQALVDSGWNGNARLTAVCSDGVLDAALAAALLSRCGRVWNAFGTDATLTVLMGPLDAAEDALQAGRSLRGCAIEVCDGEGAPCAVGVQGDVQVRGICAGDEALLVSTGRKGRWLANGTVSLLPSASVARDAAAVVVERVAQTAVEPPVQEMTASERWLADLWKELLDVPSVGVLDNFFDLGGHSLLALSMVTKVEKATRVRLNLLKIANGSLRVLAADLPDLSDPSVLQSRSGGLGERVRSLFGFGRNKSD